MPATALLRGLEPLVSAKVSNSTPGGDHFGSPGGASNLDCVVAADFDVLGPHPIPPSVAGG